MPGFEFEYPVVYFDWQEDRFIQGVIASRKGQPNIKAHLLEKDKDLCALDEAWIVGYRDAEDDHVEVVTCQMMGVGKDVTAPEELFKISLEHTKTLQRRRKRLSQISE